MSKKPSKSLAKGLLAGLIGGLAAVAVKSMAEKFYPSITGSAAEPQTAPAVTRTHNVLVLPVQTHNSKALWAEGALAGAAYGAVAEFYPQATAKEGAGFGMALASLKQDGSLAALGLAATPMTETPRERARQITLHVVFGVATETVRRMVRRILD
ncbi:hypothetical protein GCM10011507_28760 [Edaphobacter acidisoli]|uniref:DUF1440 domain-containing protein n=1 Tax=Edaphobacter acidisoli TaxID=2040573 RepID=A0A916S099_9BACT|nr:DUF1440 domain-containing protein [Edaphobacter acidisoli]GGA75644.1 hypothetical protein GCM10011507_28760 [Edaphobacter acidisoli]